MRYRCFRHYEVSGFTLVEILVVVVLVSMAAGMIAYSFQNLTVGNHRLAKRQDRVQEARAALEAFAADVRAARAVLSATPEKVSLWAADADSDGVPSLAELVNYTFLREPEQRSAPWVRETWNSRSDVVSLVELRVAADTVPPFIRHVVVHIAVGTPDNSQWIGTSVLRRGDYIASVP